MVDVPVPAANIGVTAHAPRVMTSLPDKHDAYNAIGRVAAEGARIEHILDLIIWELAGTKQELGSCITSQLGGAYGRFNAILALAAARGLPDSLISEIKRERTDCETKMKVRHRFVHDAWYTEGDAHAAQFRSYDSRKREFGIVDVTDESVADAVSTLREKAGDIGRLRSTIQSALASSP